MVMISDFFTKKDFLLLFAIADLSFPPFL